MTTSRKTRAAAAHLRTVPAMPSRARAMYALYAACTKFPEGHQPNSLTLLRAAVTVVHQLLGG